MANPFFGIGDFATEATRSASASGPRSNQDVVFVDVGSRKIESQIVRDGLPIGIHRTNPDVFDDVIVGRPAVRLTVVSQSIAPGTAVPVGATIDVVMARSSTLPLGLLEGVLTPLAGLTMAEGFDRFVGSKPQARRILARASGGVLTSADEQAVRELFLSEDISITDEPGRDIDAAVETLRVLSTFGS